MAFVTAQYGLGDLGKLQPGERLLVHAAAGGVGLAALQLARLRGAEVFATASRPKWPLLRSLGLPEDHIASSRDTSFEAAFWAATGGEGMDVVLDSLAGDKVVASLRLLPRGGRFLEMGKTDIRDAGEVAVAHPGVGYRAFDLSEAGPERLGALLQELAQLVEAGDIVPLPCHAFDVREAERAFRFMAQGRHTGKLVLVPPRSLDPDGTVLITGGMGGLARITARHLVARYGARHLVLLSRSGPSAPGADELLSELKDAGAKSVALCACDVSDRGQLEAALGQISDEHPLTAVFHTAGALDDGLLGDLTEERIDRVLGPKLDAALSLHELTRGLDLSAFVLFSSVAGTLGSAAQGSYAAANSALDALAAWRHRQGLPATSLAWGTWAEVGMAARLGEALQRRLRRGGFVPIEAEMGMRLLDEALRGSSPALVPVQFDRAALQRIAHEQLEALSPLLRGLVGAPVRRAASARGGSSLAERLARLPAAEREAVVLEAIRTQLAAVLGLVSPEAVPVDRPLQELGLDSLMAVEARNRLSHLVGERLPASLLFDYPTASDLARFLGNSATRPDGTSETLEWLAHLRVEDLREAGILDLLLQLREKVTKRSKKLAASSRLGAAESYEAAVASLTETEIDAELDEILEGMP
jgi:NADPH:quinone reductase-like Zn-dependent oxidoreductase/acyl carrier protein